MPKTITINDVQATDLNIKVKGEEVWLSGYYNLLDEAGGDLGLKHLPPTRIEQTGHKTAILNLLTKTIRDILREEEGL
jgi:hypothetical protein